MQKKKTVKKHARNKNCMRYPGIGDCSCEHYTKDVVENLILRSEDKTLYDATKTVDTSSEKNLCMV